MGYRQVTVGVGQEMYCVRYLPFEKFFSFNPLQKQRVELAFLWKLFLGGQLFESAKKFISRDLLFGNFSLLCPKLEKGGSVDCKYFGKFGSSVFLRKRFYLFHFVRSFLECVSE